MVDGRGVVSTKNTYGKGVLHAARKSLPVIDDIGSEVPHILQQETNLPRIALQRAVEYLDMVYFQLDNLLKSGLEVRMEFMRSEKRCWSEGGPDRSTHSAAS